MPAQSAAASPSASASALPCSEPRLQLVPDHRELAERRVDDRLLQVRMAVQHEAERPS